MGETTLEITRELTACEKVTVLKNNIEHLLDEIEGLTAQIRILVDDNAEIDFLTAVNRDFGTPEIRRHYSENVAQIRRLHEQIAQARWEIGLYRDALDQHTPARGEGALEEGPHGRSPEASP